jgi:hypothetical protein
VEGHTHEDDLRLNLVAREAFTLARGAVGELGRACGRCECAER